MAPRRSRPSRIRELSEENDDLRETLQEALDIIESALEEGEPDEEGDPDLGD